MDRECWNALVDAYERTAEMLDGEFRPDYSGRGMYGKTCLSIVADCSGVELGIAFAEACEFDPDMVRHAPHLTDSMGRSTVFYNPTLRESEVE